jgi:hypothetical protein
MRQTALSKRWNSMQTGFVRGRTKSNSGFRLAMSLEPTGPQRIAACGRIDFVGHRDGARMLLGDVVLDAPPPSQWLRS